MTPAEQAQQAHDDALELDGVIDALEHMRTIHTPAMGYRDVTESLKALCRARARLWKLEKAATAPDPGLAAVRELEQALVANNPVRAAERAVLDQAVAWHASVGTAASQELYETVTALLTARQAAAVPEALCDAVTKPEDVP